MGKRVPLLRDLVKRHAHQTNITPGPLPSLSPASAATPWHLRPSRPRRCLSPGDTDLPAFQDVPENPLLNQHERIILWDLDQIGPLVQKLKRIICFGLSVRNRKISTPKANHP